MAGEGYRRASAIVQSDLELMSSAHEIEAAVMRLSAVELAAFREWFADFDAEAWDRQIEDDVALSGELPTDYSPQVTATGPPPPGISSIWALDVTPHRFAPYWCIMVE
jgi:hypothetical protein